MVIFHDFQISCPCFGFDVLFQIGLFVETKKFKESLSPDLQLGRSNASDVQHSPAKKYPAGSADKSPTPRKGKARHAILDILMQSEASNMGLYESAFLLIPGLKVLFDFQKLNRTVHRLTFRRRQITSAIA